MSLNLLCRFATMTPTRIPPMIPTLTVSTPRTVVMPVSGNMALTLGKVVIKRFIDLSRAKYPINAPSAAYSFFSAARPNARAMA